MQGGHEEGYGRSPHQGPGMPCGAGGRAAPPLLGKLPEPQRRARTGSAAMCADPLPSSRAAGL